MANCFGGGVEVREVDSNIGMGMFTRQPLSTGSAVYSDIPLVSMQHTANRRFVQACQQCHMTVGSVREQFRTIFNEPRFFNVDLSVLERGLQTDSMIRCECGEVYCSDRCISMALSSHHRFMCVAHAGLHAQAVSDFKFYCLSVEGCGDNLLLLAQLLAVLCSRSEGSYEKFASQIADVLSFTNRPFSEVARPPIGQERDTEWDSWLESTIGGAFELMASALVPQDSIFKTFFSSKLEAFGVCSRILSVFELNNIDIAVPTKLAAAVQKLVSACNLEEGRALELILREKEVVMKALWTDESKGIYEDEVDEEEEEEILEDEMSEDMSDDDDHHHDHENVEEMLNEIRQQVSQMPISDLASESSFPDFHGTGFFVSVARTNHSCSPNVSMEFEAGDGTVTCRALKDIPAGAELHMSYISRPESKSVETRRSQLADYLFDCQCQLCGSSLAYRQQNACKSIPLLA